MEGRSVAGFGEAASFSLRRVRIEGRAEEKFSSPGWCVMSLRSGEGEFADLVRRRSIAAGDVVLFLPGSRGLLRVGVDRELVAEYFVFQPEELVGLLSVDERLVFDRVNRRQGFVHVVSSDAPLARKFRSLAGRLGDPGTLEHRCHLLQLLGPMLDELRPLAESADEEMTTSGERLMALLSRMRDADLQALSVSDLARQCNCSRRHLARLVKRHLGTSIIALKTQLRLERAAALLRDPATKVIEVAFQCGFSHAGSFSARFKERFGATPARWRAQVLANGALPGALAVSSAAGGSRLKSRPAVSKRIVARLATGAPETETEPAPAGSTRSAG